VKTPACCRELSGRSGGDSRTERHGLR
jgi:hypothetical protein